MFKNFKSVALCAATVMTMSMYSCKESANSVDEEIIDPEAPIVPVDATSANAMSAEDQKAYLEQVALELIEKIPASDFADLASYGKGLVGQVLSVSTSNVSGWAYETLTAMRTALDTTTWTVKDVSVSEHNHYSTIYTRITNKLVLSLANVTGHFTVQDGAWVREEAEDLQFIFNDQTGKACVLKVAQSGELKTVHLANNRKGSWGMDNSKTETVEGETYYYYNDVQDSTSACVALPEHLELTFTQDGLALASLNLDLNLNELQNGEEFDFAKSNLSCSAALELINGYKLEITKLAYVAGEGATIGARLSKQEESLVFVALTSGVEFAKSLCFSDLDIRFNRRLRGAAPVPVLDPVPGVSGGSENRFNPAQDLTLTNTNLKIDVLGKVPSRSSSHSSLSSRICSITQTRLVMKQSLTRW